MDAKLKITLLTGGKDPHYALGLLEALRGEMVEIDFIANDEMQESPSIKGANIHYYNLRGNQEKVVPLFKRIRRVLRYYVRLIIYAVKSDSQVFHILWLNKFVIFDGTMLNWFYRLLGKKLLYTAHNINIWERDNCEVRWRRIFLKVMYRGMNHIFVHTEQMRRQLKEEYGVPEEKITVIPFGINEIIPRSKMTRKEARKGLGIEFEEKVVLFFGNIAPYKGLDLLINAMSILKGNGVKIKLIIAGMVKNCQKYWNEIENIIGREKLEEYIMRRIEYIPDEQVGVYFKAADVAILPYRKIFQSGVSVLSYSFGLPIITSDVGSLAEGVLEGETGFICRPDDPSDLAAKIDFFFRSELYQDIERTREKIIGYAHQRHSWEKVGEKTNEVYKRILGIA